MSAIPEPWPDLAKRLRKIEEQLRRLSNASPFFGTGIHPTAGGGMDSDSFDGDLATNDAGTTGWAFNDQKVAVGELILRPGSIGNDSLTSPVVPGIVSDSTTTFAVTTTNGAKLSGSIPVPEGFTSAAISVVARVFALDNDTTEPIDYLYSSVTVGGTTSAEVPLAVSDNGGSGTSISPLSVVLTSLSSTVAYSVSAHSAFTNWGAADSLNRVNISGSVLWFR